ncbi:MAG: translocation/assembly module TamB domain-containing protein [Oceanicaulis sp.]|nr:translocation/assembly module TamB domain-containing protein [Oceanicaulis sp.]
MAKAAPSSRRKTRLWLIASAITLASLIAVLAIAIISAVLLMSGPFGRELVRELADGRDLAGYGELEVGTVSGNVLSRFEIERIRIRDAEGVWMEARGIRVDWSPWSLRNYVLRINALTIEEVNVSRRPVRAERDPPGPPPDLSRLPRIRVGEAGINAIMLAEDVAGPQAVYALHGDMRHDEGRWRGALDMRRTDAVGDRLLAEFTLDEYLDLDARFDAPAGGLLANLLQAETDGATGLITASGLMDSGSGEAEIYIGGVLAVDARLDWADGAAEASGQIRPGVWRQFEALQELLGGPARLTASAPLGSGGLSALDPARLRAELRAPHLRIGLQMTAARIGEIELEGFERIAGLATRGAVEAQWLKVHGTADLSGDEPAFDGAIEVRDLVLPGRIRLAAVSGPASTTGSLDAPRVNANLSVTGADFDFETLDRLIGAAPRVTADFTFVRESGQLQIHSYEARLPTGVFTGSGAVSVPGETWRIEARSPQARFNRLADAIEGEGALALTAQGDFAGALDFTAELDGFTPAGELAERLDGPLRATASGRRDREGGLYLDAVNAQGPQFVLEARGEQMEARWRFDGAFAWSGQSPLAALTLEGALEAAFEAAYDAQGVVSLRVDASAGALSAGPLGMSQARLRVEADGPLDALRGAGRLTGSSQRGPVDVSADFTRSGDTVRLDSLTGQLAAVRIDGSASAGPGRMGADLTVRPVTGFGAMALTAEIAGGMVSLRAEAEDLVGEDLAYIDQFLMTLEGPLERAALHLEAEGAYGALFRAAADGTVNLADVPGAELNFTGRYGPYPIATITPLAVRMGDAPQVRMDLRVASGRARLDAALGEELSLNARLEDIPAGLLSLRRARRPVTGTLGGSLDMSRTGGVWRGVADLSGTGLRPQESAEGEALDGSMRVTLDDTGLFVTSRAQGAGLTARANASLLTGPVRGPEDLSRPGAVLSGEGVASGQIGALAAFHLASAQSLSGRADLNARLSGAFANPRFVGDARLQDGAFSDGRAGLRVEAIDFYAVFDQSSLVLERLSATDGRSGRLTGEGSVSLGEDGLGSLAADVSAAFRSFRLVGRPDLEAIGTGDVRFEYAGGEGRISGAAVIDRAEVRPPEASRAPIPYITVTQINAPGGERTNETRTIPIRLDYRLSAPARIFVRGPNFDTEWSMDLQITGTIADPHVSGVILAERGRADMLGRMFQMEEGRITLDGDPGAAELNIAVAREAREITARVRVRGTAREPRISLSSTPALPEDEIASRLVFDQGAANLRALEYAQLAASLAALSGGSAFDPLGALRQVTGLDTFGVRTDSGGQTVVSGGRYLTDSVYLELESAGSSSGPTTRIEWALTRSISLLSRIRGDGDASVAVSWRTEYD